MRVYHFRFHYRNGDVSTVAPTPEFSQRKSGDRRRMRRAVRAINRAIRAVAKRCQAEPVAVVSFVAVQR